jgi:uncharacterized protein YabN with tetrapyrrole methylase and pyrophosphatase domain
MFSLVNLARFRMFDPEVVMAAANQKFETRFAALERDLLERGLELDQAGPDELDRSWNRVKASTPS